ncbi:MAG: cobyrinate a,c-diamide synthase [Clostridiales bacterium]|nr:cobyrinate a,c-diamide synthase [Clostridiales bacterium]
MKGAPVTLPRIMIAAPASGSGKTLVTCGLLQVLINRNIKAASFKCGPDYIDPMFHKEVIGTPSRNLDPFFTSGETVRYLFGRQAAKAEISVLEGVMGFYDGIGGVTPQASSWELAKETDTPVILVVDARGMSLSVVPLIQGFLSYRADSFIRGVILNQVSASVYPALKREIENSLPVRVYGFVPRADDCVIESRHLGLVTPDEITDLRKRLRRLAEILETSLDINGILCLAQNAPTVDVSMPEELNCRITGCLKLLSAESSDPGADTWKKQNQQPANRMENVRKEREQHTTPRIEGVRKAQEQHTTPRIAVARDEAFCFYYEDNLDLLRELGAELVFFSPLNDKQLPERIQGLLLGGGYPELYAEMLSKNSEMLLHVRTAIQNRLPFLAECGGFLYLHASMEDIEGREWPMAGVFPGKAQKKNRLGRFGYITLSANRSQIFGDAGCTIRAHEFHYYDSTEPGDAFHAEKPYGHRSWECMAAGDNYAAGFPHLYYYANPEFAARFVRRCGVYTGADVYRQ